ncbi:MAG TPA: hypothetical protein EYG91_05475 [Aquifex aeolicus]|nr:hypothetical protein [Aquifex aeolicus]
MSEEVLSKEEINFLMETLEKKRAETIPKGVVPFDFDSLEKIESERYIRLEQFLSTLSESIEEELKKTVLSPVKFNLKGKKKSVLSRVILDLNSPILLIKQTIESVGDIYLFIDSKTAYSFISLLLGGSPLELEGKPFSKLELNILNRFSSSICSNIREVWNSFFTPPLQSCEIVENIYEIDIDDEYFIADFSIEIDSANTPFIIAIPVFVLKELKEELTLSKPNPEEREILLKALVKIPITLETVLFKKKQRLIDAINLEKDFILFTDKRLTDKVGVYVGRKLKFRGQLGEVDGKRAVKLLEIL